MGSTPLPAAGGTPASDDSPSSRDSLLPIKPLLDVAAAAAGLLVLVGAVGRGVMWARYHAIGLPATTAVGLQSGDSLLAVGAGALAFAGAVGVVAVAGLYAIDWFLRPTGMEREGRLVLLAVLVLILVAAVLEVPATPGQRWLALGAGAAAAAVFVVLLARVHTRRLALAMFLLIAAVGGVLAFVRNYGPPAKLPMATVWLKDGSLTTGAFIAMTSDTLYYAPDSLNRTYGQVTALPRSDIVRTAVSAPQDFRPAGRRPSTAILGGARSPSEELAFNIDEYLANKANDAMWKYPPVSYIEAEEYLQDHDHVEEFIFGHEAGPVDVAVSRVSLEHLVHTPRSYAGGPILTRGIVKQTTPIFDSNNKLSQRMVTLSGVHDRHAQAVFVRQSPADLAVGTRLRVEGVIVDAGTVATDGPNTIKGVFLLCASLPAAYTRGASDTQTPSCPMTSQKSHQAK
jgi:hypothetical protein